jgi:hypothetical protein
MMKAKKTNKKAKAKKVNKTTKAKKKLSRYCRSGRVLW